MNAADQIYPSRPAQPGDLPLLLDLIAARPAERLDDYPGPLDVRELFGLETIRAATRLWSDPAQELAGFALLDDERLLLEMRPSANACLADQMLAWAEDFAARHPAPGSPPALEIGCLSTDLPRLAWLESHGFQRLCEETLHMARPLTGLLPEPRLPSGFNLCPMRADEVEAWVALHRAAWGTESMTVEYRRSMMTTPDYDPELDLMITAPDGTLAAYCVGFIPAEENRLTGRRDGCTDPVATHPAFQGRGLARAALAAALRLLQQRGMETARLSTGSDNPAMQRAAAAAGFVECRRSLRFSKPLLHKDPLLPRSRQR